MDLIFMCKDNVNLGSSKQKLAFVLNFSQLTLSLANKAKQKKI